MREIIAHSATDKHPRGQPLKEHAENVSAMAAACFEGDPYAMALEEIVGHFHDAGKSTDLCQRHLRGEIEQAEHATLGGIMLARELAKIFPNPLHLKNMIQLLVPPIFGHHGGLPNGIVSSQGRRSTEQRLQEDVDLQEVERFVEEAGFSLSPPIQPPRFRSRKTLYMEAFLFIKMLHSALVDCDYLDTEAYMDEDRAMQRHKRPDLASLLLLYQQHIRSLEEEQPSSEENRRVRAIRGEVNRACIQAAKGNKGFYSLTVPTGGGKTLASMGFALYHAQAHPEIQRIIYAIPFQSIIEQNAEVFRGFCGETAVLEHHSAVHYPEDGDRMDLAAENWDAPVIVTTNVQLFESLFSNKPSKCRKIHNIRNSVLILDEMQSLPDHLLKPCLEMLDALVKDAGVTVVMCTATQPKFDSLWNEQPEIREIIPDVERLYSALKRAQAKLLGTVSQDTLAEKLMQYPQVLCIVNTRALAQSLARSLGGPAQGVFHLSTMMCPEHRKQVITLIKQRLKDKQPCKVIATSLIEAGVDIDFPVVFREAAGLDSILQAAGRCNREGDNPEPQNVYIFRVEGAKVNRTIDRWAGIVLDEIVPEFTEEDLLSPAALERYFSFRFSENEELDDKSIMRQIEESLWFPFADIAEGFEMIQSAGEALFVPYDTEAENLLANLANPYFEKPYTLLGKLRPYGVTVYETQIKELQKKGAIQEREGIRWLDVGSDMRLHYYSDDYGLLVDEMGFLSV